MNPNFHIDQSILIILYFRYKGYIVPFLTVVACVVLFFYFVFPQIQFFISNRDIVAQDKQTIQTLQQNQMTLDGLAQADIEKNLKTSTNALPSEKDYVGILNGISQAARNANVEVGDYSFQVGDVFGKTTPAGQGQLNIQITLTLNAGLDQTQNFMNELDKEFPLSEIIQINANENSNSQITANFFYNPTPQVQFVPTNPVQILNQQQLSLLYQLANNFVVPVDVPLPLKSTPTPIPTVIPTPIGSASAQIQTP